MTLHRRKFLAGAGAVTTFLAGGAGYAAVRPTVLKLGLTNTRTSQLGAGAIEFAKIVERSCGDRVRVELYPAGAVGGELEMVQDVGSGALDMTFTSTSVLTGISPDFAMFDIPFLFRDVTHARAVIDSDIGKAVLAQMAIKGIVGLAWGENGLRHITTSDKPVRAPSDLKGLKMRVPQSEIMVAGFKAFGADVQSLPFPDLYPALASGAFQAQENPISIVLSANFDKVQRYISLTGHVYSPAALLISKRAHDRLSPEDQQALRMAAAAGGVASRAFGDSTNKSGIEELRRRGMTIIEDVDRPAFVAALAGVQGDFEKKFGKDKIDAIRVFGK
jgi:tripartite ATP-independent transporter DctP family solute receptor